MKTKRAANITRAWIGPAALALLIPGPAAAQAEPAGPLVIFHAGSLSDPLKKLLEAFRAAHPRVDPRPEGSGSVEAARKLTDLGKIPDLVATADYAVFDQLLVPRFARWYVTFASNAMEVAYTDRSAGAREVSPANWAEVLTRPGVRIGRSDPALDPSGYRALMVFELAERYYRRPGLARKQEANSPVRYNRPNEVKLVALLEAGELDYAFFYRSMVRQAGLRSIDLPAEIDLSDPGYQDRYRSARVTVPRSARGADSLTFVGETIVYALTVPAGAPNPVAARAFVQFVLGDRGRSILAESGFLLPARAGLRGDTVEAARWVH
jgi:molybdate/tungstate transport system substrate-binding protein